MYIESIPNRSSPPAILLRQSYRVGKKVKKKTLANLTSWPSQLLSDFKKLLQGECFLSLDQLVVASGKNFGGLYCLQHIAQKLFIEKALGKSRNAILVLLMVFGRILTQGSRRHLKFWQEGQAIKEVLGAKTFDEDNLYEALDWLEENQAKIENKLFCFRYPNEKVSLFLYDITSSYLEGEHNELAAYGYNRDGKKGKKQIVIGLITDQGGYPIAIEVFRGNRSDSTTVADQIKKLCERFGVKEAIFVGDRGMIKTTGIEVFDEQNWHYITAITKPQIESLIKKNIFQLGLFDDSLVEVQQDEKRYVLRRNPERAEEMEKNRQERIKKIEEFHQALNLKLVQKKKAQIQVALKDLNNKISRLNLEKVFRVEMQDRVLHLSKDEEVLNELARLDGCYVIKTNVPSQELNTEEVHNVYKNLASVEWAFRTMKTGFLEIRPLFHRKANRTKACAFVAMLAYMILHDIWNQCHDLGIPLEHIIEKMDQIQLQKISIENQEVTMVPTILREDQNKILKTLGISLPKSLKNRKV